MNSINVIRRMERLVIAGIGASAASLAASVFLYFQPGAFSHALAFIQGNPVQASKIVIGETDGTGEIGIMGRTARIAQTDTTTGEMAVALNAAGFGGSDVSEEAAPYLTSSGEQGRPEDLDIYLHAEGEETTIDGAGEAVYYYMTDSALGPMLYYHQGDSRWGDYLYGGHDPMRTHGCGPTVAAMLVSSFSESMTPPTAADWAVENGCYARGNGSYHRIIPDTLTAFGLEVESVKDRSLEHVSELLQNNTVLVALMGRGSLTQNGHFIIITQILENGNVRIADPNSYENSTMEWPLSQLLSELKSSRDSGAPLWAVTIPAND